MNYTLELEMKFGGQLNVKRVASPVLHVATPEDMKRIYAAFEKEFSEAYSPLGLNPEAGVEIEAFVLKASLPQPHGDRPTRDDAGPDPAAARTGDRPALFSEQAGRVDTPVYEMRLLQPGNRLAGPALIESDDTTIVVSPGWTCQVDQWSGIVLSQGEEPAHV